MATHIEEMEYVLERLEVCETEEEVKELSLELDTLCEQYLMYCLERGFE